MAKFEPGKNFQFKLRTDIDKWALEELNRQFEEKGTKIYDEFYELLLLYLQGKITLRDRNRLFIAESPHDFTPEQRKWLDSDLTKKALGVWLYELMTKKSVPASPFGGIPEESQEAPQEQEEEEVVDLSDDFDNIFAMLDKTIGSEE